MCTSFFHNLKPIDELSIFKLPPENGRFGDDRTWHRLGGCVRGLDVSSQWSFWTQWFASRKANLPAIPPGMKNTGKNQGILGKCGWMLLFSFLWLMDHHESKKT